MVPPAAPLQLSTTIICLFFGTNFLLMIFFLTLQILKKEPLQLVTKKSEAFKGTSKCYYNLTTELCRMGSIMAFTYICERHWFYEHSNKDYNRDLFMFVCFIFFFYGYMTIEPVKDLALLGREQTEEWKGWMQFIFLMYHYFHAEEVYNSVRVMITCYVWMTGFGNFSFFYIKQDFGWLRVVQMLWRLNFSVIFLMMTHGNTYILYYICPLHTFFFLMVYVTMRVYSSLNHGKWSIRWKLVLLGFLIFLIWDYNHGLFEALFFWLGTDSVIGAKAGSVWEWYFRTSLDHWSTYFGMIFALNFPLCEQLFVKAKGWPLYFIAVVLGGISVWWFVEIYSLEKLAYNLHHNYFAMIPLTSYIYFRNITPYVRSFVSMSFHDVGKTTLETYLLQHHIWLTSNAKTLLTIVPGNPWMTFAIASVIFVVLSKEMYRLTMTLRGMILPDDKDVAFRNMIGSAIVMGCVSAVGAGMYSLEFNALVDIFIVCLILFVSLLFFIGAFGFSDDVMFCHCRSRGTTLAGLFVGVALVAKYRIDLTTDNSFKSPISSGLDLSAASSVDHRNCLPFVGDGEWFRSVGCDFSLEGGNPAAFCQKETWLWHNAAGKSTNCRRNFAHIDEVSARYLLNHKKIRFCGDSGIRNLYHSLTEYLDPTYKVDTYANEGLKHTDLSFVYKNSDSNIVVTTEFKWIPRVINMSNCFNSVADDAYMYVVGMLLWDALNGRSAEAYQKSLRAHFPSGVPENSIWVHPQHIVNSALRTPEKQEFMTQEIVEKYKSAFNREGSNLYFSAVVDPYNVSASRSDKSVDGIHYTKDVYDTTMQLVLNVIDILFPTKPKSTTSKSEIKKSGPKKPESMSFPVWGGALLATAVWMLFTMDSFFGVGYIALLLSGRSFDYEAAYGPLLKKITGRALVPSLKETAEQKDEDDIDSDERKALLQIIPMQIEKVVDV